MKIAGVGAEWDRPDDPNAVLVLGHGAGGDLRDPFLRGVGAGLLDHGIATLRFNFPYREAGRKAPGPQKVSEDCYREVAGNLGGEGLPLICGGKSYGGRMATHIVADGFSVAGLVLLSYPLHPPGRPESLRDAHLSAITAPTLFVQGTRDPFATPDLLHRTIDRLDDARLVAIEGGDHSLRVKGRPQGEVVEDVVEEIARFIARVSG